MTCNRYTIRDVILKSAQMSTLGVTLEFPLITVMGKISNSLNLSSYSNWLGPSVPIPRYESYLQVVQTEVSWENWRYTTTKK